MSNRITYSTFTFNDSDLLSGSVHLENAMVSETLGVDTLTFEVLSEAIGARYLYTSGNAYYQTSNGLNYVVNDGDLTDYVYGTSCEYYHDDVLIGKFYVKSVVRTAVWTFKVECISAIGMLANVTHYGGVYSNATVSSLITSVMNTIGYVQGTDYTIDSQISSQTLSGWLPIASSRDNLQQILFAIGASCLKDANGRLKFTYNDSATPAVIDASRIYIGGNVDYKTPATKVIVTEHAFYVTALDEQVELYNDDTTVSQKLVTFDAPCHNLTTTGSLTINSSGHNYAIVSGSGTLKGYYYTHTTKELTYNTGVQSEDYEYKVTDATLVSVANSYYVAKRVANYYGSSKDVKYAITLGGSRNYTGQLVNFIDPFELERTGFIKTMDINMSGILKSETVLSTDYVPGPYGSNFVDFLIIHSGNGEGSTEGTMLNLHGLSGTFNPASYGLNGQRCRVVVFSSAKGGQGGYNGTGGRADYGYDTDPPTAGVGGNGGTGAKGIYYVSQDITFNGTYNISLGAGGAGGAIGGGAGGGNNHSSFGNLQTSSASNYSESGYLNILTNTLYATQGDNGLAGGNGGAGYGRSWSDNSSYRTSENGGSVRGYNGVLYSGGTHGATYGYTRSWRDPESGERWQSQCYNVGGGGGGACYGANGANGTDSASGVWGVGGNGASVPSAFIPKQNVFGRGGRGGHGGGGGGIPGNASYNFGGGNFGWACEYFHPTTSGGNGCAGSAGSDGFILIYTPIDIA